MIKANPDILNKDWKPQEKLLISPKGNKKIVNLGFEDFDKLRDHDHYENSANSWISPNCVNEFQYCFSMENADGIAVYDFNGCKYAMLQTCDDEGCFYFVIAYWDAISDSVKYYVPIKGNAIDPHSHDRISSYYDSKFDNWFLNNGICDDDGDLGDLEQSEDAWQYVKIDPDAARKEFESICSIEESNINKWQKIL